MSILRQREEIMFDVTNQYHRNLAFEFFKYAKWPIDCPKFYLDPQYLTVPHMIQAYLTNYFLGKEFDGSRNT